MVLQDTYHMRRHAGKTESRSVPGTRILATPHRHSLIDINSRAKTVSNIYIYIHTNNCRKSRKDGNRVKLSLVPNLDPGKSRGAESRRGGTEATGTGDRFQV